MLLVQAPAIRAGPPPLWRRRAGPTAAAPHRLRPARIVCDGAPDEGVSSGETPDSEKARALELAKLAYDPSPVLEVIAKDSPSEEKEVPVEARQKAASAGDGDDGSVGISSGETPDSEKARALELAKLAWDPSPTLEVITDDNGPK